MSLPSRITPKLSKDILGESLEDFEKMKKGLIETLDLVEAKKREIIESKDSQEEKARRLTGLNKVIKEDIIDVLEGLKSTYPEKKEKISSAIESISKIMGGIEGLIEEYQRKSVSGDVGEDLARETPEESILDKFNDRLLNKRQKDNIEIIKREFRRHNLPDNVIAAAILNALAESSLDAGKVAKNEDSVGLFQLNVEGAGRGMSIEERQDPVINTRTIITREILTERGQRLLQAAADGASIAKLAAIFSKDIERPVDVEENMGNRMQMAEVYFGEGISEKEIKQSIDEILKEARETKESIDHFRRGNESSRSGYHGEAEGHYHKAIEAEPGNPLYYLRLANTLANQGKNDEAAKEYWKAVKKADGESAQNLPILAESYLRLGNISAGKGKEREAFGLYASALTYAEEGSPIYEEAVSKQETLVKNFDNWEEQRKAAEESSKFWKLPKF